MRAVTHNQHPLFVLYVVVLLLSACAEFPGAAADCASDGSSNPPDATWITLTPANVDYGTEPRCAWRCSGDRTGRACDDECPTPVAACSAGERLLKCDAPHMPACVACRQERSEAVHGGYSFAVYNTNNEHYELLHGRGSFEHAKLYPSTATATEPGGEVMLVRDAVTGAEGTVSGMIVDPSAELHPWNDVMFPEIERSLTWFGGGTIQLQHKTSVWEPGALHSDVFLRLLPVYSELTVCGVRWPPNIRGTLYEFRYRQKVLYDEGVVVYAEIRNSATQHTVVDSHSYTLPPTSEWTNSRHLFDYTEFEGSQHAPQPAATGCLRLGFTMRQSRELLVDDIRVFANLFSNSGFANPYFDGTTAWDETIQKSWTDAHDNAHYHSRASLGAGGKDGYASMPIASAISQTIQLDTTAPQPDARLAAVLSMDVRGQGLLVVKYETRKTSTSGLVTTTFIVSKYLKTDDATPLHDGHAWQALVVPVNLYEHNEYHSFTIAHTGEGLPRTTVDPLIHVDNVILYVDNERCPVSECDGTLAHVFVNGVCEPCSARDTSDEWRCNKDERAVGCKVVGEDNKMAPMCEPCGTVGYAFDTPPTGASGDVTFVEKPGKECYVTCDRADHWYSHTEKLCFPCTMPSGPFFCSVGWYETVCTADTPAGCLPCADLEAHENVLVYRTPADEEEVCPQTCIPGHFKYGGGKCFACTESICGAEENGFSSLRLLDGLQYTSKCTDTSDSNCHRCESNDEAVHFTGNGRAIGDWCGYECIPGTKPCAVCAWDNTKAAVFTQIPLYTHGGSGGSGGSGSEDIAKLRGEMPFHAAMLVRFQGGATISTARFGTHLVLKVRMEKRHTGGGGAAGSTPIPSHEGNGVVLRISPLVPQSALVSMKNTPGGGGDTAPVPNAVPQPFDVTVDMRSFAGTTSPANTPDTGDHVHVLVYEFEMLVTDMLFTVHGFRVETMNVSTTNCCGVGVASPTFDDPKELTRCLACTHARGTDGALPDNASWDSPNDCSWVCNQDFELLPGGDGSTCEYCPDPHCDDGHYWAACTVCTPCTAPPAHATFTGRGATRNDSSSCPTECLEDFYYNRNDATCQPCSTSSALNCSTKQEGQEGGDFFELACSTFQDAVCVTCQVCDIGWNASTKCNVSADTECTPCNSDALHMPSVVVVAAAAATVAETGGGAQWRLGARHDDYCEWACAAGLLYNPTDNTCMRCNNTECGVGFYPTPCTVENNFAGCAACITPLGAVVLSVGSMSLSTSCRWQCTDDDHYNATLHTCVPNPVVPTARINPGTTAALLCNSNVCGWGRFIDNTQAQAAVAEQQQQQQQTTPCADRCSECPSLPGLVVNGAQQTSAVYTRKGSCDWVCMVPFIYNGETCVSL